MLLARVKGSVVASRKQDTLQGHKFLLIQPVDEKDKDQGDVIIALDVVAAREGDLVIFIDAREAPKALPAGYGPIDACVVGIVDSAT